MDFRLCDIVILHAEKLCDTMEIQIYILYAIYYRPLSFTWWIGEVDKVFRLVNWKNSSIAAPGKGQQPDVTDHWGNFLFTMWCTAAVYVS